MWLADLTASPTGEGWLSLAAVLDLATRQVVGWAMRHHRRVELTLSALITAVQRQRPAPVLLQPSDRGSQDVANAWNRRRRDAVVAETLLKPGWHEAMRRINGIDLHVVEAALAAVEQDIVKALQTARQPKVA